MKPITGIIMVLAGFFVMSSCQQKKQQPAAPAAPQEQKQDTENTIPTFTMNDINGKPVAIQDEMAKNKLTILDFWASWCGPCMHEAPNVVAVYNDYQSKGLGIVGISLDNDEAAWKEAVEQMHMNWTQLSDLKGWDSEAARLFRVNSIPHTVIINSKGEVLAEDLRGDELRKFVAAQLD